MAQLIINDSGMLSLIVDMGRSGYQHLGISEGGPADNYCYQWANRLVCNHTNEACIEIVGQGFTCTADSPCVIAITGAVTEITVNDAKHSIWQSIELKSGDTVEITRADNGMRSYLAIQGGLLVEPVFGSKTTVMRDQLGGLYQNGVPLKPQDKIAITEQLPLTQPQKAPPDAIPDHLSNMPIQVVEGYQQGQFTDAQKALFYGRSYCVEANSNRMAIRLSGDPLVMQTHSLVSEGITKGAIQIPPDGLPIVMLSDRQTVGGYPKLGSVLSVDCDRLAQMAPGTIIGFMPIDIHQAHNIITLHRRRLETWYSALSPLA